MEEFKKFKEITQPDERHGLLGQITGAPYTLEIIHEEIGREQLNDNVPEKILSQFNVLKNIILYSWYLYPLGTIADFKSYVLMEYALRLKYGDFERSLKKILKKAVSDRLLLDVNFRHIELAKDPQEYCNNMIEVFPKVRNELAHGSNQLDFRCISSLKICADFINQLY